MTPNHRLKNINTLQTGHYYIRNLLQAIAFQVGKEVSYRELGQISGLDPKTVERYIEYPGKSFHCFSFGLFSSQFEK
jgi:predicted AAA+ superfamily ATPase